MKFLRYMHYALLIGIHSGFMRLWMHLFMGLRIRNRKYLKIPEQFVLIANHNSHLDTVTLLASLPIKCLKNVRVVAAMDYFGKNAWTAFLSQTFFRVVLIPRKRAESPNESDPIAIIKKELDKGHSVIFFPEGTRGKAEELADFKKGIGYIMQDNTHIPVIPAFTQGLGKCLPKGSKWILPISSTITFGRPSYCLEKDPKAIVQELSKKLLSLQDHSLSLT